MLKFTKNQFYSFFTDMLEELFRGKKSTSRLQDPCSHKFIKILNFGRVETFFSHNSGKEKTT